MNSLYVLSLVLLLAGFSAAAQGVSSNDSNNASWYRDVALSPDGKTILFTHMGDIYSVPSKGGTALPLTISPAWEGNPVWSPDGKQITFVSDSYGNLDIFVLPVTGGQSTRLTFHSGDDTPNRFFSRQFSCFIYVFTLRSIKYQ